MKIDAVELRVLKMRMLKPFRTSFGVQQDRYPLLVRLDIDGRSYWGECVAGEGPWYSYETVETAWQILKGYLLPAVIGRELANVDALETLFAPVRGHHMAKACVEMAFTGALAERARKPLATFLGGVRDRVETGVSIGIQPTVDALLESIGSHLAEGYRRIKVKIEPGWDVVAVGAIRERYPEITLMADANSAYNLDDAVDKPVVGACLVGSVVHGAGGPAAVRTQLVQRTFDLLWHTLREDPGHSVRWCPDPRTRALRVLDLTRWNDSPARTHGEVVALLLAAQQTATRERDRCRAARG